MQEKINSLLLQEGRRITEAHNIPLNPPLEKGDAFMAHNILKAFAQVLK
jgi:hypothetical protein